MKLLQELKDKHTATVAEMQALIDAEATDSLTEEQQAKFAELQTAAKDLKGRIDRRQEYLAAQAAADMLKPIPSVPAQTVGDIVPPAADGPAQITVPARVKRWSQSNLRSFKGPDADMQAYKAGMWFAGCMEQATRRGTRFQRWCAEHGMPLDYLSAQDDIRIYGATAHVEGDNTYGGYLVYDELQRAIIDLTLEYGVARRVFGQVPMTTETVSRPRRTGGLTAYFVGEGDAGTHTRKTWDRVQLVAKKLMVLTSMSGELNEDSVISMADDLTMEIARANAYKEDYCGFLGDGTSTYGGITGVVTRLSALNGVDDGGGMVLASGNLFSEFTLGDFNRMVGRIPDYAEAGARWVCHRSFFHSTMVRLMAAAGGNTEAVIAGLSSGRQFLGYPVEYANIMPSTDSNSQVACLFGDFSLAAKFGDRRAQTVEFSRDATIDSVSMFETDQVAVKGTERFDMNVHDVGTATAAGPVVGLISAAS